MPRKKVQPTGAAFGAAASSSSLAGDVSTGAAGAAAADGDVSMTAQQLVGGDGIENYEVAKSHLMKVVRGAMPETCTLRKEGIVALHKGTSVVISYLAAAAQERAAERGAKLFTAADVCAEAEALGFLPPNLVDELRADCAAAKSAGIKARNIAKAKAKEAKAKARAAAGDGAAGTDATPMDVDGDETRAAGASGEEGEAEDEEEPEEEEEEEEDEPEEPEDDEPMGTPPRPAGDQ
ncbi:hypothetical protein FA09DRAFT_330874 [Tilletiopsis washingtonensis]|uniref:DNA polymerase epsilon subunit D n=1 Tax=Tilletiopsis washingtonensis TaxID=58919 RepID=A0A316Z6J5_9BASI|nr:hypothetical protein FA09DRAFT_330874 [Tilletiopsis washingtonensis]PWN97239.1 hypothetical protein FA09DRAFT_330874 [Tilletiopsis washingtonensis]